MGVSQGSIRTLDTSKMSHAIESFETGVKQYSDIKTRIERSTNELFQYWEGEGRISFEKNYLRTYQQLKDIQDILKDLCNALIVSDETYISTDKKISNRMNSGMILDENQNGIEKKAQYYQDLYGKKDVFAYDFSNNTIKKGDKNADVAALQEMLIGRGYSVGSHGADGRFGSDTLDALVKFQRDYNLVDDGKVGPATKAALKSGNKAPVQNNSTTKKPRSTIKVKDIVYGDVKPVSSKNQKKVTRIDMKYTPTQSDVDNIVEQVVKEFNEMKSKNWKESLEKYKKDDGTIGYRGDNVQKYGEWYKNNGEPWCAMFVSYCANEVGLMNKVIPKYQGVVDGKTEYINAGRYYKKVVSSVYYQPKVGDTIFFYNPAENQNHTGIVVAFDKENNKVYTIEGNSSNTVSLNELDINNDKIAGYGWNGGTNSGKKPTNAEDGSIRDYR